MSVTVNVSSPCPGQQSLDQVNPGYYQGQAGSYFFAVLQTDTTHGWVLNIYDATNPNSSCYPNTKFGQVSPDMSDPTGSYGKLVNGSPDTSAGAATVT